MTLRRLPSFVMLFALALAGCSDDSADDGASTESSTDSTETETETETETGEPSACAGFDECGTDEWCDFPDNLCGAGMPGLCTPRPDECSDDPVSVCGCDGSVYAKPCANVMGVDTNVDASACTPATGQFPCGPLICDADSFYCQVQVSDVGGYPNSYACLPLPDCGPTVDCECLATELCGENCEPTSDGFTITCPGG